MICASISGLYHHDSSDLSLIFGDQDTLESYADAHYSRICVLSNPISDGAWHRVRAERYGHNIILEVDDGDLWWRNESLKSLEDPNLGIPGSFEVDKQDGIILGGIPEFSGMDVLTVHDDLSDSKFMLNFLYCMTILIYSNAINK